MKKAVGVILNKKERQSFFQEEDLEIKKDDQVLVETARGIEFGTVVTNPISMEEKEIKALPKIVRIASNKDRKTNERNIEDAKKALKRCRSLVEELDLKMYIINASFTFEREQLLFQFLADGRVDFRDLARELASIYHTRIELRQIGVRDKAKEVGGLGMCGRTLCCAKFLNDFDSVSINMAKNQNIALNPSKINGVCGRLLCCLKYEDDTYKEARKHCPKIGSKMKTKSGEGTVTNVDVLQGICKVDVPKQGIIEVKVENENA